MSFIEVFSEQFGMGKNEDDYMMTYVLSGYQYLEAALFGFFFGTLFAFVNYISDGRFIQKRPVWQIISFKSVLYFVSVVITGFLVYYIFMIFDLFPNNFDIKGFFVSADYRIILAIIAYFGFYIILTNFLLQVNRNLGPGILFNIMTGKFHRPRDKTLIFMFLDLKDSTTIAEKLGHKRYSQFIRDCFHDLTDVVMRYKSHIYQYVGDEVVLTWELKDGLRDFNCINTFFEYKNQLDKRKNTYMKKYGFFPVFKAGMDVGTVTVTEIGDIKRDIAYHGDVLNTASRIQSFCNKVNQKLLISEYLEEKIKNLTGFNKALIGEFTLKGKTNIVKIYKIEQIVEP